MGLWQSGNNRLSRSLRDGSCSARSVSRGLPPRGERLAQNLLRLRRVLDRSIFRPKSCHHCRLPCPLHHRACVLLQLDGCLGRLLPPLVQLVEETPERVHHEHTIPVDLPAHESHPVDAESHENLGGRRVGEEGEHVAEPQALAASGSLPLPLLPRRLRISAVPSRQRTQELRSDERGDHRARRSLGIDASERGARGEEGRGGAVGEA